MATAASTASAPPSAAAVAGRKICSKCKRQTYANHQAQVADWSHHRYRCVPFDAEEDKPGMMTLSALLQPTCVPRLLGPFREEAHGIWKLDAAADLVRVFSMVDLTVHGLAPFDKRLLAPVDEAIFKDLHQSLPVPKEVLKLQQRVWSTEEVRHAVKQPDTAPLALPPVTTTLSLDQYWQWVARNKCDMFSTGVALMLKALVTQFGVPFRHQGATICEFGTVSTVFTKPYTPFQTAIVLSDAHPTFPLPPSKDQVNTPCLHRINYFKTDTGATLFVDFAAAQYGNLPGLNEASCLPVVLLSSEAEARARGYAIRSTSFLPVSDVSQVGRLRNYVYSCVSYMQEAILHLRGALFRHTIHTLRLDLPALMKAHPDQQPPRIVSCSRLDPDHMQLPIVDSVDV